MGPSRTLGGQPWYGELSALDEVAAGVGGGTVAASMIRLLLALIIVRFHTLRGHDAIAMKFNGCYTRLQCRSCGLHIWQREGLFTGKRR